MGALLRTHFRLLLAGVLTFLCMGVGLAIYGPALPAFSRQMDLSLSNVSWLVSTHWVGNAFGVVLSYLIGAKITPRMGLSALAIGSAMIAMPFTPLQPFAGAFVFGAGYGLSTVIFNPRVLKAFQTYGTAMLSFLNACFGLGAIAAPLIFLALGSDPGLAFGGIAIAAAALWVLGGHSDAPTQAAETAVVQDQTFRPRFGLLGLNVAGIGLEASLVGLGPAALIQLGVTEASAAQLLSGFFVVFLGGRIGVMLIAHLIPPFTMYLLSALAACLACIGAAFVHPGVFFVAAGLPAGLFFPSFFVSATREMGDHPRVAPLIVASSCVGGILVPMALSNLLPDLQGQAFFALLAGLAGTAALAGLFARSRIASLRA